MHTRFIHYTTHNKAVRSLPHLRNVQDSFDFIVTICKLRITWKHSLHKMGATEVRSFELPHRLLDCNLPVFGTASSGSVFCIRSNVSFYCSFSTVKVTSNMLKNAQPAFVSIKTSFQTVILHSNAACMI